MKIYRQDPLIYRHHFHRQVGGELPGFKGTRVQHGDGIGSFLGALARKAIPIIKAGVKLAAPHVKKAGKDIAKDLTGRVIQEVSQRASAKIHKPVKRRKTVRKRKKVKGARSKDIFMQ